MIDVRSVSKRFSHETVLLGISFVVPDGNSVAILGPSGSGKTTLLRLIAGLDTPDTGSIHIDGQTASAPEVIIPPHQRNIGFVFQSPALWPHMTVEKNIRFALHGQSQANAQARLEELLERTSLLPVRTRYPHQISGGEARRVALARAIAPMPRCLLFDEPLTNLDPDLKTDLLGLIEEITQASSISMIYVTHDRTEAERLADTIFQLNNGCIEPFIDRSRTQG